MKSDGKKIGLIINPVAGIGGRVGLKGSDGLDIQKKARSLGAVAESGKKALLALNEIEKKAITQLWTGPGEMGEACAHMAGFIPHVAGSIKQGLTTMQDTMDIASRILEKNIDILLFAGGDGTARNILDAVKDRVPVLGIPAGVKIHSAVYAVTSKSAGKALSRFLNTSNVGMKNAEVMDLDEEAYRQGNVKTRLYGYLKVPQFNTYIQNVKSGGYSEKNAVAGIAADIIENMEADVLYIIGPGTTTRSIMERLKLPNTLIGVDVVCNRQVILNDATEEQLFDLVKLQKTKIVVTVIGGQGHIFGRGNQQLSPRIINRIDKKNILVVATKDKLISLKQSPLIVDSGDPSMDDRLCGYIRVITGFEDYVPYKVES